MRMVPSDLRQLYRRGHDVHGLAPDRHGSLPSLRRRGFPLRSLRRKRSVAASSRSRLVVYWTSRLVKPSLTSSGTGWLGSSVSALSDGPDTFSAVEPGVSGSGYGDVPFDGVTERSLDEAPGSLDARNLAGFSPCSPDEEARSPLATGRAGVGCGTHRDAARAMTSFFSCNLTWLAWPRVDGKELGHS